MIFDDGVSSKIDYNASLADGGPLTMAAAFDDQWDRTLYRPLNLRMSVSLRIALGRPCGIHTVFWISSSFVGSTIAAGIFKSMSDQRRINSLNVGLLLSVSISTCSGNSSLSFGSKAEVDSIFFIVVLVYS